jgi:hypothetical protein
VKDITDLIYFVHEKRNLHLNDTVLKVGIDGGQGSLKVCLLIMEKDAEDITVDPESPIKRNQGKRPLRNSVKDVLILANAPDVPENYENLKVLWEQVKLNEIKMTLSVDHKVANLVLGIQGRESPIGSAEFRDICADYFFLVFSRVGRNFLLKGRLHSAFKLRF